MLSAEYMPSKKLPLRLTSSCVALKPLRRVSSSHSPPGARGPRLPGPYYLERLARARKSRARAAINSASSISTGPRELTVNPKKRTTLRSSTPKTTLITISGSGCCIYLFMHSYILSLCSDKALVFCSIHHAAQSLPVVNSWMTCDMPLYVCRASYGHLGHYR
jgi:hypothetical protein